MAAEELEKSIDDQKSVLKYVSLYNAWLITVTEKRRVLGRIWVR